MNSSCYRRRHHVCLLSALWLVLLATKASNAFVSVGPTSLAVRCSGYIDDPQQVTTHRTYDPLFASKKKKKAGKKPAKKSKGGGFGGGMATKDASDNTKTTTTIKPVKADKDSLETQWDSFAAITDLEIKPLGDPEDEDYEHFEVVDVFVQSGGDEATGWFRIGKVCAAEGATIQAALTLQKGLIFWTAVHMRRELMALGKASATSMELGFISPAIVYMGTETDGPMEQDEADAYLKVFNQKASPEELMAIQTHAMIGFRPDWNPPGFTYKRRESAARKEKSKKKGALQEALDEN